MAVAMKDCPSCGAEVPASAKRCKECFHDFDTPATTASWAGPIALLVSLAGMVAVALITLLWIVMQPQDQHTLVDQDSQSIVWTRTYVTGTTTDRVQFSDVSKIEYVMHSSGGYEIVAVTSGGDRKQIQISESPIQGEANKYAELMKKDLTIVDNTRGFGN
ncbi:MAG: hypothetical protein H6737_22365 [Alphaproteobacteria bacterium]|nr:hypothetical protein [Alphaproteobacteria bacterium]